MTPSRARHLTREGGFTLIEVLVTALIVVLLGTATASALISTTHTSGDQRVRAEADALASQDQARLRGLSDEQLADLTGLAASHTVTVPAVNGTTFTVASSSAFQDSSGNSSCASTAQDFYKVSTTVSWTEPYAQGTQSVSVDSMLSRPVVGILQNAVTDQTGAGLPGVSVTAAPATGTTGLVGQSGQTDTAGCAVFTDMTAGSYNVTVSKPGYVDQTAASAPSKPASVVATGTPAGTAFVLGQAGGIAATFKSSSSSAAPTLGGEADALSYSGSGTTGNVSAPTTMTNSVAATAFTTPTSLFPWNTATPPATPSYSNNYAVWAGKCAFQQYQNTGTSTYQLASVNPGIVSSATVQEPMLSITSVKGTVASKLQVLQPTDVVLTYRSGTCFDSYKATVAASTNGKSLGAAAPTTGWLANPGQPRAQRGSHDLRRLPRVREHLPLRHQHLHGQHEHDRGEPRDGNDPDRERQVHCGNLMTGRTLPREDGFTLIELVVAMAIAITVVIALAGIMIVTLRQTRGTLTRIDATRQAPPAMTQIENELHSACVGGAAVPIQAGSTPSKLIFLSYTGDTVSPTPVWHKLSLSGTTLTDTAYGVTATTTGSGWARTGTGTATQLLTNVTAESAHLFQYFAYTRDSAPMATTTGRSQTVPTPTP